MSRTLAVDLQLNIDNAKRQLNQLNSDAQKAFKSGGASSQQYQQAAQVAAQQRVQYRDALAQQSAFNRMLAEETKLRQQNIQTAQRQAQQHSQQLRQQYSPAGQTLAGAIPGGSILGSGLGLGGTAALAGAVAVAAAIGAVTAEFSKLGDRARELASTSSNASSQLGQLRSSIERSKISTDIAATSPGVVGFQKFTADLGTNLADAIAHATSSAPDRDKALQEKLAGGLGQGNEDWRRLKEQGVDLEQDIGIARQAQQVKWQRTERDFKQQRIEWEVQVGNQRFDLEKQASRQQFDNQIAIQKFQENFSNQQSQKAYNLSRQFAAQGFAISQARNAQDFSISQGDKRYDYSLSKSRNQQDFNLSKSYSLEDRKDTLTDMALGGASGLDYFRFNRDFLKQQRRNQQQFNIGQTRNEQDFNVSNARDTRGFVLGQQRAGQDYSLQQQQAAASRQLELQAQEYARRYEGLELQTQINRQSEDLAINFARLNQQIGFQQTRFGNQASDMAYDKSLDQSNFALQTGRQRRNFRYAQADFAGAARSKDPLGAAGLGSRDADFAAALAENARQSGQTDLFKQVNGANAASNKSLGGQVGDVFRNGSWNPFDNKNTQTVISGIGAIINLFDIWKQTNRNQAQAGAGNSNASQVAQIVIQTGNNTFNLDPGLTASIQQYVDEQDRKNQEAITDMIKRYYGG
jgi:uncharacterized membrane protein